MDKPEILKCPGCGNLPELRKWGPGYYVGCTRYACNVPYWILAADKTSAIKAWNEAAIRYKEGKDG